VSIKSIFGLQAKLSILIFSILVLLSGALAVYTSNYLNVVLNREYMQRAESAASFIDANLIDSTAGSFAKNVQMQIDNYLESNSEIKKISIYSASIDPLADSAHTPVHVIASTDKNSVGQNADSRDILPITTNQTIFGDMSEEAEAGDGNGDVSGQADAGIIEMLAPLRAPDGKPVGSIGVYMDTGPRDSLIFGEQIRFILLANLGLLVLLISLYFFLNRLLIDPIKGLTLAARRVGSPDWREAPEIDRNDEIGELTHAFNDMVESLNARDEEVKLLLEASVAVSSALNVDRILQILCEKIADSRKVTYCRISMIDKNSNSLVVRAAAPTRSSIRNWRHGVGDSLKLESARNHAKVLKTGKPVLLRKNGELSSADSAEEWEWALTPGTRSALLLPLLSKDEPIGVVTLGELRQWTRTSFSDKKIEFYQTLMNQAAVAIDNAQLYEQTEQHVQELSAMHKISQAFTSTLDYQEVVSVVAKRVGNLIGAQFASVLLPDDEGRHMKIVASYNLSAEYVWSINRKHKIPIGFGPAGLAFSEGNSIVIRDVQDDSSYAAWQHLARVQGYSSLVALPLLAKGQSIGVICIYFTKPGDPKDHEMNLLTTAANEAAIAIENARIYENLQDAFVGTIRSLAETIDAKDTYTRGHSERVSLYSEAIARGLGLRENELQTIRYAGYLHDVGKIGIPDEILSKPGKLTVEEFRVIQKHPVLSDKILTPVNFPFPVQSIVRHHHERYDGKGYPDGLKGEEIPLGARILFVADAYEAMTSDRPYRQALSTSMALNELEKNKITQFDARIVDTFAKIIKSESAVEKEAQIGA